jgi:hypothetical protein
MSFPSELRTDVGWPRDRRPRSHGTGAIAMPGAERFEKDLADDRGMGHGRRRRAVEVLGFVACWIALGYVLPIGANGYLLIGIPLTIAFQAAVRKQPLLHFVAGNAPQFALGSRDVLLAVALAIVPVYYAAEGGLA